MSYHNEKNSDPEKASVNDGHVAVADDRYHFDHSELDGVQRKLGQRHVQMIALAGTIGTGLFLGSGGSIATAGPVGALLVYIFMATIAYSTLLSLGEMTTFAPISGTFPHFAARWVDPAFGFAIGWNYFYGQAITIPVEISAAQIVLTFWDSNTDHFPIYLTIICLIVIGINLFGARWFGESEVVFSSIKLMLITGLIIAGLVIDLGGAPNHDRIGFRYWKHPGAMNSYLEPGADGRWIAMLSVLVGAGFSYQGVELVAIAASETRSPRRNIKKAVGRVFYRIIVFYILGVFVTGLLVPYDDPNLLQSTGNASESPYVIAMTRAGIRGLPHVINAAVFTSAFSAANSFLFTASRILYGLSLRGQAPKIFTYTTKSGLPLAAILAASCFPWLSFMTIASGANTVFTWFQNLTTVSGFFAWLGINATYLGFYRGLKAQGIDRSTLYYAAPGQPYVAIWAVFWLTFCILVNGIHVFWDFTASGFLTAYLNVPLFFMLWGGWKVVKRTKWWKPEEMDFVSGIPTIEETEEELIPPTTLGGKILDKLL
ncbi:general amino acid permease 1 [Clavulina sp. PMI_390]|nr:general amino acid permease 1 [Clavulina sp. PMI_390]